MKSNHKKWKLKYINVNKKRSKNGVIGLYFGLDPHHYDHLLRSIIHLLSLHNQHDKTTRYVAAVVRPSAFDPTSHPSSHPLYPMSPAAMQVCSAVPYKEDNDVGDSDDNDHSAGCPSHSSLARFPALPSHLRCAFSKTGNHWLFWRSSQN